MPAIELSIVMPCLNEADTILVCIKKTREALTRLGIHGEIIIADNGSSDGSEEIARREGCTEINVAAKGYGNALMGGINNARGTYVIMGDADDSYDFTECDKFYHELLKGFDLVQGCRLPSGGGTVAEGAMPLSHRWIGNPLFSYLARRWFGAPIHDVYCGMRGFRKDFWLTLNQKCTGMEFATEMIIKSSLMRARISEVPITLHKDGRIAHAPHLKTIRDGWRTLRFFLAMSPESLFYRPGFLLLLAGLGAVIAGYSNLRIGEVIFEAHTILYGSLAILAGWQTIMLGLLAKKFVSITNILPGPNDGKKWLHDVSLERGLLMGLILILCGATVLGGLFFQWQSQGYGMLEYGKTMKLAIPGASLVLMGIQTSFSSFMLSLFNLTRK